MTEKKADLKELGNFLDPILSVPIRGKAYRIPALDADTAARIELMIGAGEKISKEQGVSADDIELVSDESSSDFYESIFGDTYAEMKADKLPYVAFKYVSAIVLAWTFGSFEDAQKLWRAEGKAPAQNRASRRKTGIQTQQGAASTTPEPA